MDFWGPWGSSPLQGFQMRFLSLNCMGLANLASKFSIKCLEDLHHPSIFMLQETMIGVDYVWSTLSSILLGSSFLINNAVGCSSKDSKFRVLNWWSIPSRLITNLHSCILYAPLLLQKIYRPYNDQKDFWAFVLKYSHLQEGRSIIGGDLNLSLGVNEVWGTKVFEIQILNSLSTSWIWWVL